MREYIVRVDESDERWHYVEQQYTYFFGYPITEEIVRCRDCKHYEYWEFRDGRTAHDCARGGDYLFDTESDGFCAWGEREVDR